MRVCVYAWNCVDKRQEQRGGGVGGDVSLLHDTRKRKESEREEGWMERRRGERDCREIKGKEESERRQR